MIARKLPAETWAELRRLLVTLAAIIAFVVLGLAFSFFLWTFIDSITPDTVSGKIVADLPGEPISRWYLEVDSVLGTERVEVGPALYDCFEVGDVYESGSKGRCEGVVWP